MGMKVKSADREYFVNKRLEILNMINSQLDSIERFNSEYDSKKLTPNARGLNGISLLYASIEVMADEQLVKKLIALGADPRKPRENSPLDLARKQFNRCLAKERDAREEFRMACIQKTAQAQRLLDLLGRTPVV